MRTTLLLVCWLLGGCLGELLAQVPSAGPWQVVNGPIRVRNAHENWSLSDSDTTTNVVTRRHLVKADWNVNPDYVRLFLACENPLNAPPRQAGIRFAATGATLRLDAKQSLLWLAPSAPTVILQAYRGQRLVFRHEFTAVASPPPVVKGFVADMRNAIIERPKPNEEFFFRDVTMRAVPNADFATIMPEDARYRVAQFSVTPIRQGKRGVSLVFNGPQGDLTPLKFTGELGDELQIDVLLVQRQNFRGEVSEAPKPLKIHFAISSEKP